MTEYKQQIAGFNFLFLKRSRNGFKNDNPERRAKLIVVLCFVIVSFLLYWFALGFSVHKVVDGADTDLLLNPKTVLSRSLNAWAEEGAGTRNYRPLALFPPALFLLLVGWASGMPMASILLFALPHGLAGAFMFLMLRRADKGWGVSVFGGLLYMFSLFILIRNHDPMFLYIVAYALLPLLVMVADRYFKTGGAMALGMALLFALLLFLMNGFINLFFVYALLTPLFALLIFGARRGQEKTHSKELLLKYVALMLLVIVVNMVVLLPFIGNFTGKNASGILSDPFTQVYGESARVAASLSKPIYTARLMGSYGWVMRLREGKGYFAERASRLYLGNSFFSILAFFPLALALAGLLFLRRYKRKLALYALLALFFVLTCGPAKPFTAFYDFLKRVIPAFSMAFRDPWTYFGMVFTFLVVYLAAVSLEEITQWTSRSRAKWSRITLAAVFIILTLYAGPAVIYPGRIISPLWGVNIPPGYYQLAAYINNDGSDFRVMVLPLTKHWVWYTPYTWGYAGPDVLHTLIYKPTLDSYVNPVANQSYRRLMDKLSKNPADWFRIAESMNAKYVILRGDVDTHDTYIRIMKPEEVRRYLKHSAHVRESKDFGALTLYELYLGSNGPAMQLHASPAYVYAVSLQNSGKGKQEHQLNADLVVDYRKKDSSTYLVKVHGADAPFQLRLREMFDKGWTVFLGGGDSQRFSMASSDETHKTVEGYANGWTIDPTLIKEHLSKKYYRKNNDGSIDFEMTVFFRPQSYYNLGLIISVTALACLLILLLLSCFRRKKRVGHDDSSIQA